MTEAELDAIDVAADPESSAPVLRLTAEVRRLRAALSEISEMNGELLAACKYALTAIFPLEDRVEVVAMACRELREAMRRHLAYPPPASEPALVPEES